MVTDRQIGHRWVEPTVALFVGWLGVNAVWGVTSLDGTLVSRWMQVWMPLGAWLTGAFVMLAWLWVLLRRSGSEDARASGTAVLVVAAYLGGVLAFEALHHVLRSALGGTGVPAATLVDGLRFALHRSFVAMPLIPMALVWRLASTRGAGRLPLGFGDWRANTALRLPVFGQLSWFGGFLIFALVVALPAFLWFQAQVHFAPLTSGALIAMAPALLVMALANGSIEELIFRGVFLGSLAPATGARAAVWLQAVFFGLHHYGSNPVPLANALTTVGATLVGYMWGRSVIGTRGIGWAIGTHMLADLTFFSVTHVSW